jgi:hypothetical protein
MKIKIFLEENDKIETKSAAFKNRDENLLNNADKQYDVSSSSSNASPIKRYNNYRANAMLHGQLINNDSQDLTNEDSDQDSNNLRVQYNKKQENANLLQLINCLYELAIDVPVE